MGADRSRGERLQKLIARAGLASRRTAEQMIIAGRVTLNGVVVVELGTRARADCDSILVDGQPLPRPKLTYLAVNKPRGVVCSLHDRFAARLIVDLLGGRVAERVYPAGRLDADSEGLVLMTNDGELMHAVLRPGGGVSKVYDAEVAGNVAEKTLDPLRRGPVLDGRQLLPCTVRVVSRDMETTRLEVMLSEGKNQQVRRMFDACGHPVRRLCRTAIGPLQLGALKSGEYRTIRGTELRELRRAAGFLDTSKA